MIRLFLMTIISFLICFGAVSKSELASKLLNHLNQEHHSHHEHKHAAHGHDSDETGHPNDEDTTKPDHTHSFEMSSLSFSFSVSAPHPLVVTAESNMLDTKIVRFETDSCIYNFSNSVFRPPIA